MANQNNRCIYLVYGTRLRLFAQCIFLSWGKKRLLLLNLTHFSQKLVIIQFHSKNWNLLVWEVVSQIILVFKFFLFNFPSLKVLSSSLFNLCVSFFNRPIWALDTFSFFFLQGGIINASKFGRLKLTITPSFK